MDQSNRDIFGDAPPKLSSADDIKEIRRSNTIPSLDRSSSGQEIAAVMAPYVDPTEVIGNFINAAKSFNKPQTVLGMKQLIYILSHGELAKDLAEIPDEFAECFNVCISCADFDIRSISLALIRAFVRLPETSILKMLVSHGLYTSILLPCSKTDNASSICEAFFVIQEIMLRIPSSSSLLLSTSFLKLFYIVVQSHSLTEGARKKLMSLINSFSSSQIQPIEFKIIYEFIKQIEGNGQLQFLHSCALSCLSRFISNPQMAKVFLDRLGGLSFIQAELPKQKSFCGILRLIHQCTINADPKTVEINLGAPVSLSCAPKEKTAILALKILNVYSKSGPDMIERMEYFGLFDSIKEARAQGSLAIKEQAAITMASILEHGNSAQIEKAIDRGFIADIVETMTLGSKEFFNEAIGPLAKLMRGCSITGTDFACLQQFEAVNGYEIFDNLAGSEDDELSKRSQSFLEMIVRPMKERCGF